MAEQFLTIKATLDDPEFDLIEIRVRRRSTLPEDHKILSWGIERAVISWLNSHFGSWVGYIVRNGMEHLS